MCETVMSTQFTELEFCLQSFRAPQPKVIEFEPDIHVYIVFFIFSRTQRPGLITLTSFRSTFKTLLLLVLQFYTHNLYSCRIQVKLLHPSNGTNVQFP